MSTKYVLLNVLNLSDSEKSILKVLEEHKMAQRLAAVARKAGTPRTTTLHTLKKLTKWKLAKMVHCETHDRWMHNRNLR